MAFWHEIGFWLAVGLFSMTFIVLAKALVGRLVPIPGLQAFVAAA